MANAYPSDENPFPNAFVHSRVKRYLKAGLHVDVFHRDERTTDLVHRKHDGVEVLQGNQAALSALIAENAYDAFLIHFAEPGLVEPLRDAKVTQPVIIWVHGFEAEAWHRRWYLVNQSSADLRRLLRLRDTHYRPQLDFFRRLATDGELNVHFVAVSRWFLEIMAETDIGVELTPSTVIHNLIETDTFPYTPKDPELRRHVLVIRPFVTTKYGTDIAADAIVELSKRPGFDAMHFRVFGEGPLFDEHTAPIRQFGNVELNRHLVPHADIPALQAESGVFLCPTRWDSQGVSMGEAMSSGLVPVATDTSAIGEFVTHGESGLLGRVEDQASHADAIQALQDPELFRRLSAGAAERVRRQCGPEHTVERELGLIGELVEGQR